MCVHTFKLLGPWVYHVHLILCCINWNTWCFNKLFIHVITLVSVYFLAPQFFHISDEWYLLRLNWRQVYASLATKYRGHTMFSHCEL